MGYSFPEGVHSNGAVSAVRGGGRQQRRRDIKMGVLAVEVWKEDGESQSHSVSPKSAGPDMGGLQSSCVPLTRNIRKTRKNVVHSPTFQSQLPHSTDVYTLVARHPPRHSILALGAPDPHYDHNLAWSESCRIRITILPK